MKRTIAILINVLILVSLVIYCMVYLFGDCVDCIYLKMDHAFVLLVSVTFSAFAMLIILILNPPKKKKTMNSTHNYTTKNKIKKK